MVNGRFSKFELFVNCYFILQGQGSRLTVTLLFSIVIQYAGHLFNSINNFSNLNVIFGNV